MVQDPVNTGFGVILSAENCKRCVTRNIVVVQKTSRFPVIFRRNQSPKRFKTSTRKPELTVLPFGKKFPLN